MPRNMDLPREQTANQIAPTMINYHDRTSGHFGEPDMREIDIEQAEIEFFDLLERVQSGEEIVITRNGKPAARLICVPQAAEPAPSQPE